MRAGIQEESKDVRDRRRAVIDYIVNSEYSHTLPIVDSNKAALSYAFWEKSQNIHLINRSLFDCKSFLAISS